MIVRPIMLAPRTAFATLCAETPVPGVTICDRAELGLATVRVRKGLTSVLASRIHDHFSLEIPRGARRSSAGPIAWTGIGPGAWLLSCEGGHRTFATSLAEIIGDVAAIADQSDGYAILRVSGTRVPMILSKLVPLDLEPRAFEANHAAATVTAHIGVLLWRLRTVESSPPTFEIAVQRSLVASFWHAFVTSAVTS